MIVDVLVFGFLKDLFGSERLLIDLSQGASVEDLLRILEQRNDNVALATRTLAVAVNREYAGLKICLKDGDEVALLPPVSGGLCAS